MTARQRLEKAYPGRISEAAAVQEIPSGVFLVYILVCDGKPIVVGHGKRNRGRVIFDDVNQITRGHIKAIFVRAFHLFRGKTFERYFIECADKFEALSIEKDLHKVIGGNTRDLPYAVEKEIFSGIDCKVTELVIRIALLSSFDGLSDINLWRRKGVLNDDIWERLGGKFKLQDPLQTDELSVVQSGPLPTVRGQVKTDA